MRKKKAACVTKRRRNLCVAKEEAASFWPVEAVRPTADNRSLGQPNQAEVRMRGDRGKGEALLVVWSRFLAFFC